MKTHIHKIATYIALMVVSSMPFSVAFAAVENKQSPITSLANADKSSSAIKNKVLAEKNQQVVNEARDSILETQQALLHLERNDTKAALSILQAVSKKLATVLDKNPNLALITADVDTDIFDFEGDANAIKNEIKKADDLLDGGNLQSARQILAELASEIRITTINIPLGTFPLAIKNAVTLIEAGKANEAALVLNDVLNTLVEVTEIIPLPILRAEALLTEASELEHKEDMSKEKSRAEVLKFADAAKEKLKLAQLLGYGNKDDYKLLYTAIDDIKDTMHSEKSAATWAKVKQTLVELKNKLTQTKK